MVKPHPKSTEKVREVLEGFQNYLTEAGNISEIFDAAEPNTTRGCIAQAWSIAELLRCFVKNRKKSL